MFKVSNIGVKVEPKHSPGLDSLVNLVDEAGRIIESRITEQQLPRPVVREQEMWVLNGTCKKEILLFKRPACNVNIEGDATGVFPLAVASRERFKEIARDLGYEVNLF